MKAIRRILLSVAAIVVLAACGDSSRFIIEGEMEGGRTTNMRYVYYNGSTLVQGVTAVRDGRFSFDGNSPRATVIELYDNDYRPLGWLYAANGDEISCTISPSSPHAIEAGGRPELERWSKWLREHSDALASGADPNVLVAEYVGRNPDDIVSALLLATLFDASKPGATAVADSLLNLIPVESRPLNVTGTLVSQIQDAAGADSRRVRDFRVCIPNQLYDSLHIADKPMWLFAFYTEQSGRGDSIVKGLRDVHRHHGRRVRVVDLSLDADTMAWRRITRPDSADWTQAWLPGGTAAAGIDSLALPRLPYFVVADSAGRQLLRTPSITRAIQFIDHLK